MTNLLRVKLLVAALATGLILVLGTGCGVEKNEDYTGPVIAEGEEPVGSAYHPFDGIREHDDYLEANGYDFTQCTECHGPTLQGVPTGSGGERVRDCTRCHAASSHMLGLGVALDEHAEHLRQQSWDHDECLNCHVKTSVPEGTVAFGGSCSAAVCHKGYAGGPDACNTCHGNFTGNANQPVNWAPPVGIGNVADVTEPAVGAHRTHMATGARFADITCSTCHAVPTSVDQVGHIEDDTPGSAEVRITGVQGLYNSADNTCNTYCHGDATPVWTEVDGTWNSCGSCHGLPPAAPHPQNSQCGDCHSPVYDNGSFVNGALHANGQPNVQID